MTPFVAALDTLSPLRTCIPWMTRCCQTVSIKELLAPRHLEDGLRVGSSSLSQCLAPSCMIFLPLPLPEFL